MNNPNLKFAVALPIFNEEDNIETAIKSINAVLESIPHETKIIAVNDGSKDRSLEILSNISEKLQIKNVLVVNHPVNRGYGGACFSALERGFQEGLDYVLFMDCDLTQDPKYIRSFVPKMLEGHTMIKGSRYIKGGEIRGVEAYRKVFSYVGNKVASVFWNLPIKDFTNGFEPSELTLLNCFSLKTGDFLF